MVFNSLTFFVFLVVNLCLYWGQRSWTGRKLQLLIASYLFYAAWNPPFVFLLAFSTSLDYWVGLKLGNAQDGWKRKALLGLSLCSNLGLLATFKYTGFLLQTFTGIVAQLGVSYVPPELGIVLPVGISFYTFQTLSYSIDLYRRRIEPCRSVLDFSLFVSFFPQLVAGPIVRASEFLDQLQNKRRFHWRHWEWGMTLIVVGMFQKVVLADSLVGRIADTIYQTSSSMGFKDAWTGTLAFAWQILFDFAGYSTIAIGVAMMFGFALPRNFRWPYAANGFSDFWQRWHVSLSSWLRDYLYIPLGGNRISNWVTSRNLMLTMLLGGLWHGAAWTFVAWGAIHGALLMAERWLRERRTGIANWFDRGWGMLVTFPFVCFTWVFFRAMDFGQALKICAGMTGLGGGSPVLRNSDVATVLLITVVGLAFSFAMRNKTFEEAWSRLPRVIAFGLVFGMTMLVVLSPSDERAFIYFQF